MARDELEWLEAALGAVSKINAPEGPGLEGARCPKCNAADFAKISDLYSESAARIEQHAPGAPAEQQGGMTDLEIVRRFVPPGRTSPMGIAATVGIILAALAFLVYERFGEIPGEIGMLVAVVVTAMVLMTMARKFSDRYYDRRQRWNRTYLCRQCGQLVSS
jgi:hypothetical protein